MQKNYYTHILTETEKHIIENHFIFNKDNSFQNFQNFTKEIIKIYSGEDFDNENIGKTSQKKYSIELIWNKKTYTTAMMYCFGHHKFDMSNNKLKYFNYFNGNLNAINKDGKTALMFLATGNKSNYFRLKELLNKPKEFDIFLKTNDGKNVYFFALLNFFEKENFKNIPFDVSASNKSINLLTKIDFFIDILLKWEVLNDSLNQKTIILEKTEEILNAIHHYKKDIKNNKTYDLKKHLDYIDNQFNEIEKVKIKLHLETSLSKNNAIIKKLKI